MNRECGPQCVSCGAVTRINPKYKYDDELFTRGCQNIVLQRAVDRKLMIGESQLEGVGFGLYLGESVRKGEYLSEYAGEVCASFHLPDKAINVHRLSRLRKRTAVVLYTTENTYHSSST